MKVEWSPAALDDLDRFARFLNEHHPSLAKIVAREIVAKVQILADHPLLGRPVAGHVGFREMVMQVVKAIYVFQYRVEGDRIVILRIFHGREVRRP